MTHQILISEAFMKYHRDMSRVYRQLTAICEGHSWSDRQLILEGMFDWALSAAKGTGKFLGKTTRNISDFSQDIYNKGVELGKKAVDIGRELVDKVGKATVNAVEAIKKAPGRFMDACRDMYASVSNECGEIYKQALKKGGDYVTQAKKTITDVYARMAAKLAEGAQAFMKWAQTRKEDFLKMVEDKKQSMTEAADKAKSSGNSLVKQISERVIEIYQSGKEAAATAAKNVAFFAVGMVVLPFYVSLVIAQKTYELGKDAVEMLKNGMIAIEKGMGEIWQAGKQGWEEGYSGTQQPKAANERRVHDFGRFVKLNY